jgi:hypothetical protein
MYFNEKERKKKIYYLYQEKEEEKIENYGIGTHL